MHIDLGSTVYTSDGDKLGTVKRLVLDANSRQISKVVVDGGFLSNRHRLVDIAMVSGTDADGIRLNVPKSEAEQLPDFVQEQFVDVPRTDYDNIPYLQPSAGGAGLYLYGAPGIGRGYEGTRDSFYDAAPESAPIVENRSNLLETDIVISTGTDVYGSDGEKMGSVDEVYIDERGTVSGFLVKSGGFLMTAKNDVRVPIDWVAETGSDRITLNLPAAEADSTAYDVEDTTL